MFIIQFISDAYKEWQRSSNPRSRVQFSTAEEAQAAVDKEEGDPNNDGLRYRIVPLTEAPDPALGQALDKLNRIQSILDESN
jgi:hypothetical protein